MPPAPGRNPRRDDCSQRHCHHTCQPEPGAARTQQPPPPPPAASPACTIIGSRPPASRTPSGRRLRRPRSLTRPPARTNRQPSRESTTSEAATPRPKEPAAPRNPRSFHLDPGPLLQGRQTALPCPATAGQAQDEDLGELH